MGFLLFFFSLLLAWHERMPALNAGETKEAKVEREVYNVLTERPPHLRQLAPWTRSPHRWQNPIVDKLWARLEAERRIKVVKGGDKRIREKESGGGKNRCLRSRRR